MKKNSLKESNAYDDIIDLPRHESSHRSKMPIRDRAAQFAPFSAVVGHGTAVKEAARLTVQKRDLDETQKNSINECLREIESRLTDVITIEIIYFEADASKTGGKYVTKIGQVKKILVYESILLMSDGQKINIEDIYSLGLREESI